MFRCVRSGRTRCRCEGRLTECHGARLARLGSSLGRPWPKALIPSSLPLGGRRGCSKGSKVSLAGLDIGIGKVTDIGESPINEWELEVLQVCNLDRLICCR